MKSFVLLSAVLAAFLIVGISGEKCKAVEVKSVLTRVAEGNKLVGGDAADLSSFINAQFKTSYKYLLLSMNFNSFIKDRPGFNKLFRAESDKLFDDSIKLAKHMTSRGYTFNSESKKDIGNFVTKLNVNLDEMKALDAGVKKQKALISDALDICGSSDKEIQHYFQENILKDYTGTLRKFSGYYNNLKNFGPNDYKLGAYLFDEYLQKQ